MSENMTIKSELQELKETKNVIGLDSEIHAEKLTPMEIVLRRTTPRLSSE